MGQSLVQNYVHLVFSTKHRQPLIHPPVETELHNYLGGTCKELLCPVIKVGGYTDLVHILFKLSPRIALMDVPEHPKALKKPHPTTTRKARYPRQKKQPNTTTIPKKNHSFAVRTERKYYHPFTLQKMITKETIITTASRLFTRHGIKAVTMDKIVKELHTSKRTIYNHFSDKIELLHACIATYHSKVRDENEAIIKTSSNAIEAMGHLHQRIVQRAYQINPNFYNDLHQYYPDILRQSYRDAGNFAHSQLIHLAEWGIKDGLFKPDLDVDVVGKTVLCLLRMLKDNDLFPLEEYSKERLTFGIMVPYLRGLCTTKGIKLLEKQEELYRVAI